PNTTHFTHLYPPPHRHPLAEPLHRFGIPRSLLSLLHQPLDAPYVGVTLTQVEHVSRRARENHGLAPQRVTQVGQVALQRVHQSGGGRLPPDDLYQPARADDLPIVQRQCGHDRLAPQPLYWPRLTICYPINRPEQPYSH